MSNRRKKSHLKQPQISQTHQRSAASGGNKHTSFTSACIRLLCNQEIHTCCHDDVTSSSFSAQLKGVQQVVGAHMPGQKNVGSSKSITVLWTGGCCYRSLSLGQSTQGCWEAFNLFLLTLCGSAFSPGISQMILCLISMTTAMDSIQMGNPSCVRWQHPPPLPAPGEWQQPGEACKGE